MMLRKIYMTLAVPQCILDVTATCRRMRGSRWINIH